VAYYGLGIESQEANRTNFRFKETYVDGNLDIRPFSRLPIKGRVGYEQWNTMEGSGSYPSIEQGFNEQTAPGLGMSPGYVHTEFSAGIDWRQSPGFTRRGGFYGATIHDNRNRAEAGFTVRDSAGETWFLAFDPKSNLEAAVPPL
jgi:hypothetical protein